MRQTLSQCPVSSKPQRVYQYPSLQRKESCYLPYVKEDLYRNNNISVSNTEEYCCNEKEISPDCLKAEPKFSRYFTDSNKEYAESDSNFNYQHTNINRQQEREEQEYEQQQQQLSQLNFKQNQMKKIQQCQNQQKPSNKFGAIITTKCIPLQRNKSSINKIKVQQPIPLSSYENIFNRMPPYSYKMSKQQSNINICQNNKSSLIVQKLEEIKQKKQNDKTIKQKQTEYSVIGEFVALKDNPEIIAKEELQKCQGPYEQEDIPQESMKKCPSKYYLGQRDFTDEIQYQECEYLNNKKSSCNQSLPSFDPAESSRQLSKRNPKQQQEQLQKQFSEPNQILKQNQQVQAEKQSCQPNKNQLKSQKDLVQHCKQKQQQLESCSKDCYSQKRQKNDSNLNDHLMCISCENKELIVKKALQQQIQKAKQDLQDKLVLDAIQECGHSIEVSQMISECLKKREMGKYLNQQLLDKCQKDICEKQKQAAFDESNKKLALESLQKEKEEKFAQLKSQREIIQQEMLIHKQMKFLKQKKEKETEIQYKRQQDQAICEALQREQEEEERKKKINKAHIDELKQQINEKHCIPKKKEEEISFFRYQEEINRSIESKLKQLEADTKEKTINAHIEGLQQQKRFKERQKNQQLCEDKKLQEIQEEDNAIRLMNEAKMNAQIQEMKDQTRNINMQLICEKANRKALERKKDLEYERMQSEDRQRRENESILKVMPCNQCNVKYPMSHLNKMKTNSSGFNNANLQSEECDDSNDQIESACDGQDQQ